MVKIEGRDWPAAYCDACESVQPIRADVDEPGKLNPGASVDLVCVTCAAIVATLHEMPPRLKPSAVVKRRRKRAH